MMTALSKQAQSMHLCVCVLVAAKIVSNCFSSPVIVRQGKNVRKRSLGWGGEWLWAAMAVRVCVSPYVVHGVNLRIECEKGDVTPPQDFKSLHFLIAGGEGCA